eukprot:4528251-Amphidinium_carterae.2
MLGPAQTQTRKTLHRAFGCNYYLASCGITTCQHTGIYPNSATCVAVTPGQNGLAVALVVPLHSLLASATTGVHCHAQRSNLMLAWPSMSQDIRIPSLVPARTGVLEGYLERRFEVLFHCLHQHAFFDCSTPIKVVLIWLCKHLFEVFVQQIGSQLGSSRWASGQAGSCSCLPSVRVYNGALQ